MDNKNNTEAKIYSLKDLKNGKYQISINIEREAFNKSYKANLEKQAKTVEIKGFRKGMVPTSVIEETMKDAILKDTFEKLAPNLVMYALQDAKISPLVPVKYLGIPSFDGNEDLHFEVEIISVPKFTICDLKKVKVAKKDSKVTDKELEETVNAMYDNQIKADEKASENNSVDSKKKDTTKREIDDKWATTIAGKYQIKGVTSLAKLKEEIKKLLEAKKVELIEREFERDILSEAVKLSKIQIPDEAVEYELAEREHSFMHQLEDMKISMDQYLQAYNITEEKLKEAWKVDSKQAIEEHVLLTEYAKNAEIKFDENEFVQFIQNSGAPKEYMQNYNWLQSMQSVYFKNKAFEKLLSEVKTNLGVADSTPKKKIELIS
ncbi:MAG TPA: trigger factor [Candidatus Dojkabacteria bacterium]|nr:trigger factor [Candidatus Dojkabacteria bacterium]